MYLIFVKKLTLLNSLLLFSILKICIAANSTISKLKSKNNAEKTDSVLLRTTAEILPSASFKLPPITQSSTKTLDSTLYKDENQQPNSAITIGESLKRSLTKSLNRVNQSASLQIDSFKSKINRIKSSLSLKGISSRIHNNAYESTSTTGVTTTQANTNESTPTSGVTTTEPASSISGIDTEKTEEQNVTTPPPVNLNVNFMKELDALDDYMFNYTKVRCFILLVVEYQQARIQRVWKISGREK